MRTELDSYQENIEKIPNLFRGRILLYTAVIMIIYSVLKYDSFSSWKFLAVFVPLFCATLFFRFRRWGILIPLGTIIWFGVMFISVGTIYNHDSLMITGPLVCPEGYEAKVRTLVQNPVPGETYTSSQLYCEDEEGTIRRPVREPHFTLLLLYLLSVLPAFLLLVSIFKILTKKTGVPWLIFATASIIYLFYFKYIWENRDIVINSLKNLI